MQNDPVNFVDPTGLDVCYPDPATGQTVCIPDITAGVTVNIPGSGSGTISSGGSVLGGDPSNPFLIVDPPSDAPTGGDGVPQNPVPQPAPDPGQPLSPCVKNRLTPYFPGLDLNKVRVQEGIPDYVPGDPLAYTEGNRIYYKKGEYDPHSVRGLSDIGHELTHGQQYAQLGTVNFQSQYLGEYLQLRRLGLDHDKAYWNISFEREARKKAEIIRKDLSNLSRDFGGRDPCPR